MFHASVILAIADYETREHILEQNAHGKHQKMFVAAERRTEYEDRYKWSDDDCATRIKTDGEASDEAWVRGDPEVLCAVGRGGVSTQGRRRNNRKGQGKEFDGNGRCKAKEGKVESWISGATEATGAGGAGGSGAGGRTGAACGLKRGMRCLHSKTTHCENMHIQSTSPGRTWKGIRCGRHG